MKIWAIDISWLKKSWLIEILKWKIYDPIIYLKVENVDSFQRHVCLFLYIGFEPHPHDCFTEHHTHSKGNDNNNNGWLVDIFIIGNYSSQNIVNIINTKALFTKAYVILADFCFYLDRQTVSCSSGYFLQSFRLKRNSPANNRMRYDIRCCC